MNIISRFISIDWFTNSLKVVNVQEKLVEFAQLILDFAKQNVTRACNFVASHPYMTACATAITTIAIARLMKGNSKPSIKNNCKIFISESGNKLTPHLQKAFQSLKPFKFENIFALYTRDGMANIFFEEDGVFYYNRNVFANNVEKSLLVLIPLSEKAYRGESYITDKCVPQQEWLRMAIKNKKFSTLCLTFEDTSNILGDLPFTEETRERLSKLMS